MEETLAVEAAATAVGQEEAAPEREPETLEEVISRHRKEKSKLQDKETSLKKAAAKGSKAEQKAKKKQVEEEISCLSAELEAKHAAELASFGYKPTGTSEKGNLDTLVKAIAGVSVSSNAESMKPGKAARRREKKAKEEAARDQRIEEEQANLVTDRMLEDEKLEKKLKPLGLTIREIKPDGHCLYRAIENQLSLHSKGTTQYNHQELRQMAAKYMRDHAADFLPFFLSEGKAESGPDPSESFEKYCEEMESTAAWGGQLELGALTHCLKKHIMVYSGSFPDVEMGKEYSKKSESGSDPSIRLSYHRHAYGLGEHYNSVIPTELS